MSGYPGSTRRGRVCVVVGLLTLVLALLVGGCGGADPGSTETSARPTPAPTSRAREAPGSPLRIPLPTDELLGDPLPEAEAELTALIAEACGGDQCINVRVESPGGTEPSSGPGCENRVVSVPGTVSETPNPEQPSVPVLYVPRGGTITLVVELSCEESGSSASPSATETSASPDGSESTDAGSSPEPTSTATSQ